MKWFSKTAYSNYLGNYTLSNAETGSGKAICSKAGYQSAEGIITVNPGETVPVDFVLLPLYSSCTEVDFEVPGGTECWNYNSTGGCMTSDYIKTYCDSKGKFFKLTAFTDKVYVMNGPYDEKRVMDYGPAVAGWEAGYIWLNKQCLATGKWYFCRYNCTLVQVSGPASP